MSLNNLKIMKKYLTTEYSDPSDYPSVDCIKFMVDLAIV